MERPKVLLVEDEDSIREGLSDVLAYHGYAPSVAATGTEGLKVATEHVFPLVILDVMLPGLSGLDVCKRLRERDPELAILMLTARGSEDDVVAGFRAGADDYVTKPFSLRELVARVEALMRRRRPRELPETVFDFGGWQIDAERLVAVRDGESRKLTVRELALLRLFHEERGRVVSRRRLLRDVWSMSRPEEIETRTVDMHIAKLRKKIEGGETQLIETVRGAGYRFNG